MKCLAASLSLFTLLAIAPGCVQRVETSADAASVSAPDDVQEEVTQDPVAAQGDPTAKAPQTTDPATDDPAKVDDPPTDNGERPVAEKRPAKTTPRPANKNKPYDITFDTIKFGIEKGQKFAREMLTEEIEGLVGQRVRIRGYMLPSYQQSGIVQFVLVRDNMECCFGPGAAIYDCVLIEMQNDQTTDYKIRPVTVDGYFDIKPIEGEDGNLLVLYQVRGLSVR